MSAGDLILFCLSILVAGIIGYLAIDRLFPPGYPLWLILAFSPAAGLSICSIIVLFFRRPMPSVEAIVLVVLLALWVRAYRSGRAVFRGGFSSSVPVLAVVFFAALGWTVSTSVIQVQMYPHGGTDGWAVWASHARYIAAGGPTWKADILNTFHPDYPLLLPGALVHAWRFMRHDSPEAGGLLGIVFLISSIAILVATLMKLRSFSIAMIMGFVILGTPGYVLHSTSQFADIPLSVYILATVALLGLQMHAPSFSPGLLGLAGFMAGSAAWTKNEGIPFAVVTAAALLAPVFWQPSRVSRRLLAFTAGMALPLVAIVFFKLTIAPANDMFEGRHAAEVVAKVFEGERYLTILRYFFTTAWTFGRWAFNPFVPILAFIGFSGLDRKVLRNSGWRTGAASVAMLVMSYFAFYVITPVELQEHLDGSLDRLLLHVWPAILFLAGLSVREGTKSANAS